MKNARCFSSCEHGTLRSSA